MTAERILVGAMVLYFLALFASPIGQAASQLLHDYRPSLEARR